MSTTAHTLWHLGSMNDGLFIINTPPSPAGTDAPPGENPRGPTMVLNITDLPVGKAQKIVDAHNAAVNSHDAITAITARIAEQEKRIEALKAALKRASDEFCRIDCTGVTETRSIADAMDFVGVFARRGASDISRALTEGEGA